MPVLLSRRTFLGAVAAPLVSAQSNTPPAYPDKHDLLYYLDAAGVRQPVTDRKSWELRRTSILDRMQQVMGPLPYQPLPPRFEVLDEAKESTYLRRKIRYISEGEDWVPAWLLLPGNAKKAPAVLCLHQTTRIGKDEPAGLGGKPNLFYARELAERGFVTLAPDYPNFGEYKFDPYANGYASATMKGILNHMRAVDVLQSLRFVDPKAIGVCGHSLGGHNSLFVAAFDQRLRAVVTSCGFTAFPRYFKGDLTGWSHKGYMPRIADVYGKSPDRMPFDFPEILGAIAPRAIFINAPTEDSNFEVSGVRDSVAAARPIFDRIHAKKQALVLQTPSAGHDFPPDIRVNAYRFLQRHLR
ncbi:MAG: alpha/beta fold hydrolase [Bryobacterales bacterium]|nr:alpha/beta fold hydrolase [Bryobacterales bacterium]